MILVLLIGVFAGAVCDGIPVAPCGEDEFPCNDGSCIDKLLWCDTESNCKDHSDERYCFQSSRLRPAPNNCDETFFVCKHGPCIPLVGRCDGYFSCLDGSDEEGCPTETSIGITYMDFQNSTNSTIGLTYSTDYTVTQRFKEFTTEVLTQVKVQNDFDNTAQADSGSTGKKNMDKNLENGFKAIDPDIFKHKRALANKWLLNVRDQDFSWGDETPRALIALYSSGNSVNSHDNLLMSKQLHVQIFTALIRNRTAPIPLSDLSLFINALAASCHDPRNFYGQNLVEILRQRTDKAESSSEFITPLVYLTLCLNGATNNNDFAKFPEILKHTSKIHNIDTEALLSLSATCISRIPKFASHKVLREITYGLYTKVVEHGLPKSIYKLALVTQALNEARINQNKWNRSEALTKIIEHQFTNGSFGDILSTYYAMPILSGRSLLSLGHQCVSDRDEDFTPLEILQNGDSATIYIKYALYFGDPLDVSQTIMMKVKNMTGFLDIMRMAETINPVYKFMYDMNEGKPEVYSIGGVVNDPERGLYWKLHVASSRGTQGKSLLPYEGDIRSFKPEEGSSIVFWMKSLY